MDITPELIDKLAQLAKLDFSPEEKAALIPELEKITGFMDKLSELDVTGVPPLTYLSDTVFTLTAEQRDLPRADVPEPSLSHDAALQNAPKRDSDYFRVPKVLDKSEG
jgi:aspartyl-tRNA(Asn)/glutamyl-tRNA(Gln) amidotransferase subunit C